MSEIPDQGSWRLTRWNSLAWYEMRLVLGVLVRRFEVLPDPATDDGTMAPVEHFFVVPKYVGTVPCEVHADSGKRAMRCQLRIQPAIA